MSTMKIGDRVINKVTRVKGVIKDVDKKAKTLAVRWDNGFKSVGVEVDRVQILENDRDYACAEASFPRLEG